MTNQQRSPHNNVLAAGIFLFFLSILAFDADLFHHIKLSLTGYAPVHCTASAWTHGDGDIAAKFHTIQLLPLPPPPLMLWFSVFLIFSGWPEWERKEEMKTKYGRQFISLYFSLFSFFFLVFWYLIRFCWMNASFRATKIDRITFYCLREIRYCALIVAIKFTSAFFRSSALRMRR